MRLLWWMLAVVSSSVFTIVLSESRVLDPVQNASLIAASPIQGAVREAADPVSDFFRGVFNRGDLVRENEELRRQVEELQAQLAASEDAQRQLEALEDALDVKESFPDHELLVADVIAQDPSGVKRAVAIDRGSGDGLDEGMVVLSPGGSLVGTLSMVYDDFAWLRLVSDPNSAVNVTVLTAEEEDSQSKGVAVGGLDSRLTVDMLPPDAPVQEGNLVVTSGLGGNYPRSLLLGTINSLEDRPQALTRRATLEPATDIRSLETVLIITTFLPARLTAP